MLNRTRIFSLILLTTLVISGCTSKEEREQARIEAMQSQLASDQWVFSEALQTVYKNRAYAPLWVEQDELNDSGQALLRTLADAHEHGLDPTDYSLDAIRNQIEKLDSNKPDIQADTELRLSSAYLAYAEDMLTGRFPPKLDKKWHYPVPSMDAAAQLTQAADSDDIAKTLAGLAPTLKDYQVLVEARKKLVTIMNRGGWSPIQLTETLEPGQTHSDVSELRKRLQQEGYYDGDDKSQTYDQALQSAVKSFQRAHGLNDDGRLGAKTRKWLNVSAIEKLRSIDINLERMRSLPRDLGERYVWVNLTNYRVKGVIDGQTDIDMRVVIGKQQLDMQTPAFADVIQYVEINPYWNIPESITIGEMAPAMLADPNYLASKNIKVLDGWGDNADEIDPSEINWNAVANGEVTFRLRQEPGNGNALGRMKIMFPNDYNIYLHDTPAGALFSRDDRTFSHGCIRLHKPKDMTLWVLSDHQWGMSDLQDVLDSMENTRINLKKPIPVYIVYLTAWADDQGNIQYRDDFYNRDAGFHQVMRPAAQS